MHDLVSCNFLNWLIIHKEYWLIIFLSCDIFFWLWFHGNIGLIQWIMMFSFLLYYFGIVRERLMLILLYMFGRNHHWSLILDFSLLEGWLLIKKKKKKSLVLGICRFIILPNSVLVIYVFLVFISLSNLTFVYSCLWYSFIILFIF